MCGILGINYNKEDSFEKALNSLRHRGTDNFQILQKDDFIFGHTRLSIIDLDDEANQPMEFDDITITFNGEIYNYKELIKSEKLVCMTASDTEVIIRLYQLYGTDFLHLLNGMFSFCLYDESKSLFFCARDRFGKKPFFYYKSDKKFIFSSEIKAILKLLSTKPAFNRNSLALFLQYWSTVGPETFYENIYSLGAGEYLIYQNHNIKINKYYDLCNKSSYSFKSKEDLVKKIEQDILSSLELRLVGDREVAALLSGGLDSSLLCSMYSKITQKAIHTFSIGYKDYKHYSELQYAQIVAKHIDSIHHEIEVSKDEYIEYFERILKQMDEPIGDSAIIPTYILCEHIADSELKVALSGEGSDEIFLGYTQYFDGTRNNQVMINQAFTDEELSLLLQCPFISQIDSIQDKNLSEFQQFSYNDFHIWIAEVLMRKLDRMSMLHTLELRAPFLDFRLVDNIFGLDDEIKKGSSSKSLLKQIALKYLPEDIVYRKKKGFSSPFIEWIYESYQDKILDVILKVNKETEFFKEEQVIAIYNRAKQNQQKQQLWNIYIFSRWYEKEYM